MQALPGGKKTAFIFATAITFLSIYGEAVYSSIQSNGYRTLRKRSWRRGTVGQEQLLPLYSSNQKMILDRCLEKTLTYLM